MKPPAGPTAMLASPGASVTDTDTVIQWLYSVNYLPLLRLAQSIVRDRPTAEEIVQEAFLGLQCAWPRLRDTSKALSYLRRSVVNGSWSVLRHRAVAEKYERALAADACCADHAVTALLERSALTPALRRLPARQREAIALQYYAGLSQTDVAAIMGISTGAVKSHTARAMSALRTILG